MNWWCASSGEAWTWSWQTPYLGALVILAGVVGVAGWWSTRGRHQPWAHTTPEQWKSAAAAHDREVHTLVAGTPRGRSVSLVLGSIGMWLVIDWPLASLGAGYLATAQMARQILMVMVVAPLLLFAIPPALAIAAVGWGKALTVLRWTARPRFAVPFAALTLIVVNTPAVVDPLLASPFSSFLMDLVWTLAGFTLWMPVQCPHPGVKRLTGPAALGYLIAQSIVPVLPGFFMTWADYPIYATYELAPRVIEGFDAITDQQTAAAVLQVGGMVLLWLQIGYRFLTWGHAQMANDQRGSRSLSGSGLR